MKCSTDTSGCLLNAGVDKIMGSESFNRKNEGLFLFYIGTVPIFTLIMLIFLKMTLTPLFAAEIVVQPKVSYSISGTDDLTLLRSYYQGGSWQDGFQFAWKMLSVLGVKRFRLLGVDSNIVTEEPINGEIVYHWSNSYLERVLNDCERYGTIPHICPGNNVQPGLANKTAGGKLYGVKDWELYKKYAYALFKYVMVDRKFKEAAFEIGNEPDIGSMTWLFAEDVNVNIPADNLKVYQAYFNLYKAWAEAAALFVRDYPDLKFRIGGPAVSITAFYSSYNIGSNKWIEQFIEDVKANNLKLDFVSFHFFGANGAILDRSDFGPSGLSDPRNFSTCIRVIRNKLQAVGLNNVLIYITEWDPGYVYGYPKEDKYALYIMNAGHEGAAWAAAFLLDMLRNKLDVVMSLILVDGLYPNTNEIPSPETNNWSWFGYVLSFGQPRANYNVLKMFSMLPGTRIACSGETGNIGALASADRKNIGVLVFNYNWDYSTVWHPTWWETVGKFDRTTTEKVQIRINGLPFEASSVPAKRYLMDETHSNAYWLYKNGRGFGEAGLQMVEDINVPVQNGVVDLPVVSLGPSGVTLWVIKSPGQELIDKETVYSFPNPALGDAVTFKCYLRDDADITIDVFNIAGERIASLTNSGIGGMRLETRWDITNIASGVYIYKFEAKSKETGDKKHVVKKQAIVH